MEVNAADTTDAGTYRVRAENDAGSVEADFVVNVESESLLLLISLTKSGSGR